MNLMLSIIDFNENEKQLTLYYYASDNVFVDVCPFVGLCIYDCLLSLALKKHWVFLSHNLISSRANTN